MFTMSVIGNLVAAPTTREVVLKGSQDKVKVCNFRVAINSSKEHTEYVNVSAWRGLADVCSQYLDKGRKVYVEGMPRASAAVGKDNQVYANLELSASRIEFLSPRPVTEAAPAGAATTAAPTVAPSAAPLDSEEIDESLLPF